MNVSRPNLMWPVLIIGIGITLFLIQTEIIPEAIGDLLIRSWPVLLIMLGLNVLLAGRLRFANWLVLIAAIVLVVVIANIAYAQRRVEYRSDYKESRLEILPPEVEQLVVRINVKTTRATISEAADARQVEARFAGSNESDVEIQLTVNGATALLTISEDISGILPRLDEVGRGTLNVFLPPGVPIEELAYTAEDGSMTVDLRRLSVGNLDLHLERGNMALLLPFEGRILRNAVRIDKGNLRMVIPDNTALRLNLGGEAEEPTYLPANRRNDYQFLVGGILETRRVEDFRILLEIRVEGAVTLDHTPPQ